MDTVVDGRYHVRRLLARGGMSTVYLATDRRLERDVALKVLFPHLADDQRFLERFEQEAKSAARLSHPHVVGVLDQRIEEGPDGGVAYLVMEYVPGRTLRDLLRERGRLTPRQALAMLDPVVEGLAAAHEAGIIHRDVKPENVLLAESGGIKIADFGLARAISAGTNTGTLVGTAAYLPPELVTGDAADARSDIYSAGIMLFELLTGSQPYRGDAPIRIAYQHVHSRVPAPSTLVPGLAQDLDELVLWCTAKDPEERPIDGNALLGELRHVRTTLSDADLDVGSGNASNGSEGTGARTAIPAGQGHHHTEVIGDALPTGAISIARAETVRGHSDPTHVLGRVDSPTTILGDASHPTTAFPRSGSAAAPDRGELSVPAQEKLAAKDLKAYQKERARAAQRPQRTLRTGGRRRNALIILLLSLLALLAAAAGWFLGVGPGAAVAVPDVSNRPLGVAQALLAQSGLAFHTEEAHSDSVEEGLVIASDPPAPAQIRPWERVHLLVSLGPELFALPETTGFTEATAAATLVAAGFNIQEVLRQYSDTAPEGTVITTRPAGGEQQPAGASVALVVSQGPQPVEIPPLVGLLEADAVAALEASGLVAKVAPEPVNDVDVPVGAVVSQTPAGGQLARGETVTLTLSAGPRLLQVPDVFSVPEAEAISTLEEAGFEVEVDYAFGRPVLGLVAGQDLTGEHPEGSAVTITVT